MLFIKVRMHTILPRIFLRCTLLLAVTLNLASCGGGGGNDSSSTDSPGGADMQAAIEAAVAKNLKSYGARNPIPGAIVGVWSPQGSYVKGIGVADLSTGAPMTTDLHVRIASITKTFVTTVILQLVDEGKVSLDDPLSKFNIGIAVPNAQNITIRELCNMTSGLFEVYHSSQLANYHLTSSSYISPQQLVGAAIANPPIFSPGAKWSYSDTNFAILGLVIENATGNSLAEEINRRLLQPLHLSNTSFPVTDPSIPSPFAHGYGPDGAGNWTDLSISLPPSVYWGIGNMISTVDDLHTWVRAFVTGTTNSAATQTERLNCDHTSGTNQTFGLGTICSAGWYGFTGGISGYNSAAYYLPESDSTIIVLVNSLRPNPDPGVAMSIVHDIAKSVFPGNVPF